MSDCFIKLLTENEKRKPDAIDAVLNERTIQLLHLFCQKGRKMINAIVYTTNTGNTERYAKMLGQRLGLPVYALEDAKKTLEKGTGIIYLGWIMASGIKGYKDAEKHFFIRMVCAVGMGATGTQLQEVRNKNQIPSSTEVFTLQGGFDMGKLRGVNKLMMSMMVKTAGKALAEKTDRTPEEDDMLDLMINGGSRVSMENLSEPVKWYEQLRTVL